MKIAMVFDGLMTGGVERVGADYARLLGELGHQVTVFNLRPDLTGMESEFPSECKLLPICFPKKMAPEYYSWLVQKGFIHKIAYPVIYAALTLENSVHKRFFRQHSELKTEYDIAIAFSGHYNDLTFVASRFVKAKHTMCWLHGALYSYILLSHGYLNLYKKIKNLSVLVDDAQEEVLCYHPDLASALNINKIYNPTFIAERTVDPVAVSDLKEKYGKFLLMVSRFSYPHKDHYTVAKAFQILREKYDSKLDLVFVGSGPEEDKVRDYVQSLGTETASHVHFMGTQTQVQNFYAAAHCLVHASVAGEGLPTIMLEAMAYDLPMVVTDSKVGPREILRENEYGLLCRVQDSEDMATKIYHLCQDKNLYKEFQTKGRQRIKDFHPETIKKQLEGILKEITGQQF